MTRLDSSYLAQQLQFKRTQAPRQNSESVQQESEPETGSSTNAPTPTPITEAEVLQYNSYIGMLNKNGITTKSTTGKSQVRIIAKAPGERLEEHIDEYGRVTKTIYTRKVNGKVVETIITEYTYEGENTNPKSSTVNTYNGTEDGELKSLVKTEYRDDGSIEKQTEKQYENGLEVSYKSTAYKQDGWKSVFECKHNENGETVLHKSTSYRPDGSVYVITDYLNKGKDGTAFYVQTYFRKDGTVNNIIEYSKVPYITGTREFFYAKDGKTLVKETQEEYNDGKLVKKTTIEYTEDGKKPAKETIIEYAEDGETPVKETTITYEYDTVNKIVKKVELIEDKETGKKVRITEEYYYEETEEGIKMLGKASKKDFKVDSKILPNGHLGHIYGKLIDQGTPQIIMPGNPFKR